MKLKYLVVGMWTVCAMLVIVIVVFAVGIARVRNQAARIMANLYRAEEPYRPEPTTGLQLEIGERNAIDVPSIFAGLYLIKVQPVKVELAADAVWQEVTPSGYVEAFGTGLDISMGAWKAMLDQQGQLTGFQYTHGSDQTKVIAFEPYQLQEQTLYEFALYEASGRIHEPDYRFLFKVSAGMVTYAAISKDAFRRQKKVLSPVFETKFLA